MLPPGATAPQTTQPMITQEYMMTSEPHPRPVAIQFLDPQHQGYTQGDLGWCAGGEPSTLLIPEQGMMAPGFSRVMSPNDLGPGGMQIAVATGGDRGLLGCKAICNGCHKDMDQPMFCAKCGIYGHEMCLGILPLYGYYFCLNCHTKVTQEFAQYQDSHNQAEQMARWTAQQAEQIRKETA